MKKIFPRIHSCSKCSCMKNSVKTIFFLSLFLSTNVIVQLKGQNENPLLFHNVTEATDDYLYLSKAFLGLSLNKSMEYSLNALKNAKASKVDSLIGKAYKSCGVSAFYSRQYQDAIFYYDSANIYFERAGKMQDVANNFNNIGLAYSRMKDHLRAIDNLYISLEKNKQIRNSTNIGLISNNIGALYYELKAFKKANEYFEEAYTLAVMQNNKQAMLTARNNMGMVQNNFRNNSKALEIFKECVTIAKELQNYPELGDSYLNIGNTFLRKTMPDSAMHYLQEALHFYKISDRPVERVLLSMGRVNLIKGNKKEALRLFQEAKPDKKTYDPELLLPILKELYPLLEEKGDIAQAYAALKEYHLTFDTLKSLYDSTAIVSLEAKFELENKTSEIKILQKEKEELNQLAFKTKIQNIALKSILYFSLLAIIVLLIISIKYFKRYRRTKQSLQMLAEENNLNREASTTLAESLRLLTQKEETLRNIINNSPDIICYKDGNGHWIEANRAKLELFGIPENYYEMKTDKMLASFNPDNEELFKAIILSDELCWQKGITIKEDFEIIDRSGSKKIFEKIKIPLFKADGSRKGLVIIGRDITERKSSEAKLKTDAQTAKRNENLKTTLLANISHEIRTPLNAIVGFSELLVENESINSAEIQKYVQNILENGLLLQSLINEISDASNTENTYVRINPGPVRFNKLFKNVEDYFKKVAALAKKQHLKIQLNIPEEQYVLKADEQKIRQILLNLFNNALKHTEKGFIETGFEIKVKENGENIVRIFMKDSGKGITEEIQRQLQNQFEKNEFDFNKAKTGSGLGLDIIYKLVKNMGGDFFINSKPGSGTEISIELEALPEILPDVIQEKAQMKIAPQINLTGKEILIVEDNYASYEMLKIMLESMGAKARYASNGKDAIEIFSENPNFDLVLMDIQMPILNGLDATVEIKKINPDVPVVAQTALAMINEREACIAAGCDEYIAKPIKLKTLMPVLNKILG
jgi:PAS domain S-box-containing protein